MTDVGLTFITKWDFKKLLREDVPGFQLLQDYCSLRFGSWNRGNRLVHPRRRKDWKEGEAVIKRRILPPG